MELFSGHFQAKRIKSENTIRKLIWLHSVPGAKLQLLKFGGKVEKFQDVLFERDTAFSMFTFCFFSFPFFSLFCSFLLVFFAEHLPGFISEGKFSLKIVKYNFQGSILWVGGGTKYSL